MSQPKINQGEALILTFPHAQGTLGAVTLTMPDGSSALGVVEPDADNGDHVRRFPQTQSLSPGYYALPVTAVVNGQALNPAALLLHVASAYHTDIYTFIRDDLLHVTPAQLSNAAIDRDFKRTLDRMIARYPFLVSYQAIPRADWDLFDQAISYIVAVRNYPLKFGGASGKLQGLKTSTFEFRYADDKNSERHQWVDEAAQCLELVSLIRAHRAADAADWNLYDIMGPTREALGEGVTQGVLNAVLDLAQDPYEPSLL